MINEPDGEVAHEELTNDIDGLAGSIIIGCMRYARFTHFN